jgi:hypothetical protein
VPEGPKPAPHLDETAAARPWVPPAARRGRGLVIVAAVLFAVGAGALLLGAKIRAYTLAVTHASETMAWWWDFRLLLIGAVCGLGAAAGGLVAVVRMRAAGRPLLKAMAVGLAAAGLGLASYGAGRSILARVGEDVKGSSCKNHLRQIGIECRLYADEHRGAFPGRLEALALDREGARALLYCPRLPGFWEAALPSGWVSAPPRKYVYVSGLRQSDPGDCVLAYDWHGDGGNVLTLDSNVRWIQDPARGGPELGELLEQTRQAVRKRGGEIRLVGE